MNMTRMLIINILVFACVCPLLMAQPAKAEESGALAELKNEVLALHDDYFAQHPDLFNKQVNVQIADYLKQYELDQIDVLSEPLVQSEYYRDWYVQSVERELESMEPTRYFSYDDLQDFIRKHSRHELDFLIEYTKPALMKKAHTIEEMERLSDEVEKYLKDMEINVRTKLAESEPFYISRRHVPDSAPGFTEALQQSENERTPPVTFEGSLSNAYVIYLDHTVCNMRAFLTESTHDNLLNIKIGPAYAALREQMDYDPRKEGRMLVKNCMQITGGHASFPPLELRLSETFSKLAEIPLGRRPPSCSWPDRSVELNEEDLLLLEDLDYLLPGRACGGEQ